MKENEKIVECKKCGGYFRTDDKDNNKCENC